MGLWRDFRIEKSSVGCGHSDSSLIAQAPVSHEVWRQAQSGKKVTLPHHSGDMAEGTLRTILRQAEIDVSAFLKA